MSPLEYAKFLSTVNVVRKWKVDTSKALESLVPYIGNSRDPPSLFTYGCKNYPFGCDLTTPKPSLCKITRLFIDSLPWRPRNPFPVPNVPQRSLLGCPNDSGIVGILIDH